MAVYQQPSPGGKARWMIDLVWVDPATGKRRRIRRAAKDEKQRPAKSRTAAQQAEHRLRGELAAGTFEREPGEASKRTLAEFWPRYLAQHVSRNKPSSRAAVETIYREHLVVVVGAVKLDGIGAEHYARIASRMRAKGRAPKSINNALSCLRTALDVAHEWGLRSPPEKVRWLKAEEPTIEWFSRDEIERLVSAGAPIVTFALKTGLRLGELRALEWADVGFGKAPHVTVSKSVWDGPDKKHAGHTKSNRVRVVPLPPSAIEALKTLPKPHEGLVFKNAHGGQLSKNECRWPLWRACDAAEVERCGWHKLRHSYVSALVRAAVPLPQVQKLAGHARIDMTMRYTHVDSSDLARAVSALE